MGTFRCVVCTPTAKLFDDDVAYASMPSEEGYFGVLPGHELHVALTGKGGLCTINLDDSGSNQRKFLIFKGASQMFNGILTILASYGIAVDDIDADKAEKEAENIRNVIEDLKSKGGEQNKTRIAIFKRNLEWYEFQLDFLKNGGAN